MMKTPRWGGALSGERRQFRPPAAGFCAKALLFLGAGIGEFFIPADPNHVGSRKSRDPASNYPKSSFDR